MIEAIQPPGFLDEDDHQASFHAAQFVQPQKQLHLNTHADNSLGVSSIQDQQDIQDLADQRKRMQTDTSSRRFSIL